MAAHPDVRDEPDGADRPAGGPGCGRAGTGCSEMADAA
jgi:hypothetical protein